MKHQYANMMASATQIRHEENKTINQGIFLKGFPQMELLKLMAPQFWLGCDHS